MATLRDHPLDAEDFTADLLAGWSQTFDPVTFGLSSGADTTEPDWWTDWFGDGSAPYDPAANNLTCWLKFTVPAGSLYGLTLSTEGSDFDTSIFVFTMDGGKPWFDWSAPPFPGTGRLLAVSEDYAPWMLEGVTPPSRNSLLDPVLSLSDTNYFGQPDGPSFGEGTYLVCIGAYMGSTGNYVLSGHLAAHPAPNLTLTDSLYEAIDIVPLLPADGTPQRTPQTDVSAFTSDVNDPTIQPRPEMPAQGSRAAWCKAVLPTSGVLTLDARMSSYKTALFVFSQANDGALSLVESCVPYAIATASEPDLTARVMNGMTPGSGSSPTGMPGVTHAMLAGRSYSMCELTLRGPDTGWDPSYALDVWRGSPTHSGDIVYVDIDVWLSAWNTGFSKLLYVSAQWRALSGEWWNVSTPVTCSGLSDSRTGDAVHVTQTLVLDDTSNFTGPGPFRLVVTEGGSGGEIWTKSAKLTVRGYWNQRVNQVPVLGTRGAVISRRFEPGTYLVCLSQYVADSANTLGRLDVSLTHPRL